MCIDSGNKSIETNLLRRCVCKIILTFELRGDDEFYKALSLKWYCESLLDVSVSVKENVYENAKNRILNMVGGSILTQ